MKVEKPVDNVENKITQLEKTIEKYRSELDDCQEHFALLRESQIRLQSEIAGLKASGKIRRYGNRFKLVRGNK